jgi:hypothetical protein
MTTDREMERIVRSWLEPGLTTLTDDVLDPVLDQLPATPQRRRWSPARRIASMNPIAKFAIAAAAVVVIAIVGFNLVGASNTNNVGNAPPTTIPSEGPASSLAPLAPTSGEIEAGRYRWSSPSVDVTFDLPAGWIGNETYPGLMMKNEDEPGEFGLNFTNARYQDIKVWGDGCAQDEPVLIGETVDDLVTALDDQVSTDAVVGEIAAGSVTGKRIELRQPAGLDRSQCRDGVEGPLLIWANGDETDFVAWGVLAGQEIVYVFDVDGTRLVFAAPFGADAPEAQFEEVDTIVRSFEFSPH